ncbi:MAG: hypothetical protein M3004_01625 [Bacteroidota bacterium]|nr:hypothetical protein [Bacteroidota bacterium]
MKLVTLAILFLLSANICSAQFLKNLGKKIKEDAGWQVRNKADNEVRKGLDSVFNAPKKIKEKKKEKQKNATDGSNDNNKNSTPNKQNQNPSSNLSSSTSNENDVQQKDGFVTLNLSAKTIFTGGSIRISGESIKYKDFNQVEIKITGPSYSDVRNITLNSDGKYALDWVASNKTGDYTVTVKGSDKKSVESTKFSVAEIDIIFADDWPEENIRETQKALDKLQDAVDKVEPGISSKDKAELEKKMDEVKQNVTDVLKLFKDLNIAGKQISQLAKSGKRMSPNLASNLSDLNANLNDQASQMKNISEEVNHEPQDNTICEYLVMVKEACAAFLTFTNIWTKSVGSILENIAIDKVAPKGAEVIMGEGVPAPVVYMGKEATKAWATAQFDAHALSTKLGKGGFAADMVQFATETLLKKYCGVFKGTFTHDYKIEFRNGMGQNWWTYGVEMKGVLFLRYPKGSGQGNTIKMKGNMEGNATKFTFFEDIAKEDDFYNAGKGVNMQVIPIKTFTPLAVSIATSQRDIMDFGAIARGLATPATFNFVVDAEYDVNANEIKLFLTKMLMDFTPWVANQFVFLMTSPLGILMPRRMIFPIHKAFLTLGALIKEHNKFEVEKDSKGNLGFEGKYNKHIGNKTTLRETDLNFFIKAEKE